MGGGLLQLVAYGAQDVYLSGNPQITFFKVVYRRHTNFAMEAIQQTFSGIANYGNTVYCQISRNGDLIHRTYLEVDIPILSSDSSYVNYLGLRLLKSVLIEIGGQQIDKHYSDWLYIWNELSLPVGKRYAWDTMVGADANLLNTNAYAEDTSNTTTGKTKLYIPLEFWFCRNIGLALPLIALQYHEVKIKIEFESRSNCIYKTASDATTNDAATVDASVKLENPQLWVDYIYLDTDERRKFAQLSHEYLIEQLQFTGSETLNTTTTRVKLNFNHPCKELIWVAKLSGIPTNGWYNYTIPENNTVPNYTNHQYNNLITTNSSSIYPFYSNANNYNITSNVIISSSLETDVKGNVFLNIEPYNDSFNDKYVNPFTDALLQLNGNDRFAVRNGEYFNLVQPYQHHTNIPFNRGINVYSFAIKPEEHQPSGTLNMSRIDTAVLTVTPKSISGGSINIYAVNYNVLRILSGMGGLAYSN